ncbi:hypothetical protein M3Y99_01982200 [Aphelenchoides fujianensis]|nr:hypothetical protein M3Y99_01982200 [Aphelenchoides fujianensis]
MALTVVFEENIRRVYRAHTWSTANFWRWLSETLIITLTLVLAFESQGFWKKTNTYLEQPAVQLSKRCMIVLGDGSADPFNYFFWSPFGDLNRAQADRLVMPVVEVQDADRDQDSRVDEITMNIALRMTNTSFRVRSVYWMLFYSAQLKQRAVIDMNGAIYGEIERLSPAADVSIAGDLRVWQRKPLPSYGRFNLTEDLQQLNETELVFASSAYVPFEMQRRSLNHNYTLQLDRPIQHWNPIGVEENATTFTLNFHFFVPEQELTYRCDALELLKWVWIQYLALSVLVRWLFDHLSGFLFQNQIFPSIVHVEALKQKDH